DHQGRPGDAITPAVVLAGEAEPRGHIITIMNKAPEYSVTPDLLHLARKTNDPAQRRSQALKFFSATYYQKHREFSDSLTATFPPHSPGAAKIAQAPSCILIFEAYGQRFELHCKARRLAADDPLYQATIAHNGLFNPALPHDMVVLGFAPDWQACTVKPSAA
ncbi:MAG: hypothetical protein ACC631_12300, partial [Halocynthiibacter sp.]